VLESAEAEKRDKRINALLRHKVEFKHRAAVETDPIVVRTMELENRRLFHFLDAEIKSVQVEKKYAALIKHFGDSFTLALPDFSAQLGFGLQRSNSGYLIGCPHWALVAVSVIGTALATRASCRFSLRTLLIATTLVAVLLGVFVALR
jgi:hypothetical protein